MALRDLVAKIRIKNDAQAGVDEAAQTVEQGMGGAFTRVAAVAATVGVKFLEGVQEAVDSAQSSLQQLQIATGAGTPRQQELLDLVQRQGGFTGGEASAAIAAQQGRFPGLAQGEDLQVALTLAQLGRAGADPGTFARTAATFGITDAAGIQQFADVTFSGVNAQDADLGATVGELGVYGPVLRQAGLGPYEALGLQLGLERENIDLSRVSPAFNRAVRDASAAGLTPRAYLEATFGAIQGADPDLAASVGQQLFGAEGGLRVVEAFRDPEFSRALNLTGPGLGAIQPTDRQLFEEGLEVGSRENPALAALYEGIGGIPLVGDAARAGAYGLDRLLPGGVTRPPSDQTPVGDVYNININAGIVANEQDVVQFINDVLSERQDSRGLLGGARYE